MYKNDIYTIKSNIKLTNDIYKMVLEGDTSFITAPGQFVNIQLDGFYLRRPISVSSWNDKDFTIIYKVVGKGTKAMAEYLPGKKLDILTGLGNGFNVSDMTGKKPVLIGGGVGVPPMYGVAECMVKAGVKPVIVLGFNDEAGIFYSEEFRALGLDVYVTTVDGSVGIKGFVTDALKDIDYDTYLCCGPKPMLKAVYDLGKIKSAEGQLSFEEHMGCGFGACMGCSCKTITGNKRICTDGPVFKSQEVIL